MPVLLILLNQIYPMKKLFIVRLFTIVMLAIVATGPAIANNNNNAVNQTPAAKPAPYKQAPVPRYHKPTHEDTVLMNDKSINGQYKYLLTKIFHYQEPQITTFY